MLKENPTERLLGRLVRRLSASMVKAVAKYLGLDDNTIHLIERENRPDDSWKRGLLHTERGCDVTWQVVGGHEKGITGLQPKSTCSM